jgi:hypothetical protein
MTTQRKSYKIASLELTSPRLSTDWLEEPRLLFANDKVHPDPKTGIPLYGPRSLGTSRHKNEIHIGFIGTSQSVDRGKQFYRKCSDGIDGDDQHEPFPGCRSDLGFRSELRIEDKLTELISRQESEGILGLKRSRERFENLLQLLQQKMIVLTQRDYPLDYVVLVLSPELYKKCRTTDYFEKGKGRIHRDLRLAFKAMAMQYHKPTQILRETTTGLTDSRQKLDHESVIAWNLFTGMYFKVDGLPWGPTGLLPASCHVGISFFRPLGESSTLRASVVQAFDENGDGLVLRGHRFHWDDKQGKSPHLSAQMADDLISMVLERYKQERNQLPQRVVVHKTSGFEPDEQKGFESALAKVQRYDLISLCPTSQSRLLRAGKYPPLRGTSFGIGDVTNLYTSGYIPTLGRFPHGHVPSPLRIGDHIGDTAIRSLMQEIMVLTKMNWNSANFSGLWPITLRFSRLVGEVLREIGDREPEPKYKFYM